MIIKMRITLSYLRKNLTRQNDMTSRHYSGNCVYFYRHAPYIYEDIEFLASFSRSLRRVRRIVRIQ